MAEVNQTSIVLCGHLVLLLDPTARVDHKNTYNLREFLCGQHFGAQFQCRKMGIASYYIPF